MKNKKAIFVCGSGGSGKTTFVENNLSDYTNINVDLIYEKLLIDSGLGLKIINFNDEQYKNAYKLFDSAKILNDTKLLAAISNGDNIVIDGIGRNSDIILSQKNLLEKSGYSTYMVIIYSDLEKCIMRVNSRNRVYNEQLTIDSWHKSYSNIPAFKKEFGKSFLFIYNDNNEWIVKLKEFKNENKTPKTII
jgi:predicted kinase